MRRVHPSEGCPAMKTYSSKSNATRAARNAGLPASAVTPGADGTFTLTVPVALDGVDGPPTDDLPVVQLADDQGAKAVQARNAARVAAQQDAEDAAAVYAEREAEQARVAEAQEVADAQRDEAPVTKALGGIATPFPGPAAPPPMLVSLTVPAADAPAFALALAKRSGLAVEVTDCVSGAVQTFQPPGKAPRVSNADKAPRTPRTPRAAGELGLSGKNLVLLGLAQRPDGLNDVEGCAVLGWKGCLGTLSVILKAATVAGMPVRRWKGADGKGRYAVGPAP